MWRGMTKRISILTRYELPLPLLQPTALTPAQPEPEPDDEDDDEDDDDDTYDIVVQYDDALLLSFESWLHLPKSSTSVRVRGVYSQTGDRDCPNLSLSMVPPCPPRSL